MDKLANISIFLDILDQFLCHLEERYPVFKSDLFLVKTSVGVLFMSYILPYSTQIENCQEEFFLNFENLVNKNTPNSNLMHAMKIRGIWRAKDTTDIDKAQIWIYFKKLLKVGKRVI